MAGCGREEPLPSGAPRSAQALQAQWSAAAPGAPGHRNQQHCVSEALLFLYQIWFVHVWFVSVCFCVRRIRVLKELCAISNH